MRITATQIPDVKLVSAERHADSRGWFSETYRRSALAAEGLDVELVQENHSLSLAPGTIRGLHLQAPPCAQVKLVRVVRGAILDVAVDARRGAPTYGRHVAVELRASTGEQLLIPEGFLHGFCTLEADTEVLYRVSAYYAPASELGVRWDDPDLAIRWPSIAQGAIVSAKDAVLGTFAAFDSPFHWAEGRP